MPAATLAALAAELPQVTVLVDEAYIDFSAEASMGPLVRAGAYPSPSR